MSLYFSWSFRVQKPGAMGMLGSFIFARRCTAGQGKCWTDGTTKQVKNSFRKHILKGNEKKKYMKEERLLRLDTGMLMGWVLVTGISRPRCSLHAFHQPSQLCILEVYPSTRTILVPRSGHRFSSYYFPTFFNLSILEFMRYSSPSPLHLRLCYCYCYCHSISDVFSSNNLHITLTLYLFLLELICFFALVFHIFLFLFLCYLTQIVYLV